MSKQRSARDVVEEITGTFETVDSNQVREVLETYKSPAEAFAALDELGASTEEMIDPEIVIDYTAFESALTPDAPQAFHGREGWLEMWRLWLAAWEDYKPEAEIEELDDEHVLVIARVTLKGRGSGVEIEWVLAGIWTVREGRLVSMHNFLTREEALAALERGLA